MSFASRLSRRSPLSDRSLKSAALALKDRAACHLSGAGYRRAVAPDDVTGFVEAGLVSAAWTLRRLPDRESGFLRLRGALWPDAPSEAGAYPAESLTSLQARRRVRITAAEVDAMQPMLDLLLLLPDLDDRRLLFWAAWHQDGEPGERLPWAKVRRSLGSDQSRWTLKRRYDAGLLWLARLICLQ